MKRSAFVRGDRKAAPTVRLCIAVPTLTPIQIISHLHTYYGVAAAFDPRDVLDRGVGRQPLTDPGVASKPVMLSAPPKLVRARLSSGSLGCRQDLIGFVKALPRSGISTSGLLRPVQVPFSISRWLLAARGK